MMNPKPWGSEFFRLFLILCGCLFLYKITANWLIFLSASLLGYIIFIGYKLNTLMSWLEGGAKEEMTPESGGVIGNIISLVYRHKKALEKDYEHQQEMVKQFTGIISAIPSATVIINQNREIEWANYPALMLLGINGQQDVGVKVDNLLRQAIFRKHLSKGDGREFEMISPIDPNMTLVVQLAPYTQKKNYF